MTNDQDGTIVHRRDVVCGGGAVMFNALLVSLLGDARPTWAQGINGPIPEVDRVAVRVVVDSYQIAVAPSLKADSVEIQRFGWPLSDQPPQKAIISEFGLSLHAESQRGSEVRNVLVDFGFTSETLLNNSELLGVDPAALDALALSHGHYDHFGGLVGFVHQNRGKLKPKLPLYVGGEECFCARTWTAPPLKGNFGALDRKALAGADVTVIFAEVPTLVADQAFTTGQINLASFERVLSPSVMKIGVQTGIGCYPEQFSEAERQQGVIPDQFRHELTTGFKLRGRGLVVLTSCSHRGVVNAIKRAQAVSGISKVHAVIGGFHLAPYPVEYVRQSVAALKEIDPDYVIPLHCTGEPFYEIFKAEMPEKLLRSFTGTRFVFNA
ncbi:MBL fold metallo-hydrolase [Sinorhizobium mexicanum]|uniref:MBL fold metallo-hydrolase n=1 Tax=Sinorhizobium mexicanum TaxID=375549 RepID=A0A859QHP9_9HYPH|nr:MBL fold metallo-hydrolase [Sinorhizobium mexicanum]MBP1886365.1 7,8-dihydropterin-6-yl-methyl-4-(beta-D-ribofuranosyl)aminobenzene 5'-phosphate synthase [Sinorhizobium mexicanum]QLL64034.1 MBL fold metallo-hydrolase [Sinorhizobium mexicanum]